LSVLGCWAGCATAAFTHQAHEGSEQAVLEQGRHEEGRIEALRGKSGGERIVDLRREMTAAMERGDQGGAG
jgi:succinate dehydrogenase/fumarate reductase flavoprotein subunit